MAYLDRPALLYIVRAPVLKVEVAGQKMFLARALSRAA
jgi:hypothetical protein